MNAKDEGQQVIKPVPLRLLCPACGHQHVDVDEWAARLHRTHLCDQCGHEWAPSQDYTVGVARALAYCEDLSALQQQVTELEGKAELADIFYQTLCELKKYRDKPDYLAHEMAQMLNSFEENYDALTSPSTIA